MLKLHGKDNQAVRPTSGKAPTQHQVRGDKHLRNKDIFGSRWTRTTGSGAAVLLPQEYATTASTSHTNTEPLALVTIRISSLRLANP